MIPNIGPFEAAFDVMTCRGHEVQRRRAGMIVDRHDCANVLANGRADELADGEVCDDVGDSPAVADGRRDRHCQCIAQMQTSELLNLNHRALRCSYRCSSWRGAVGRQRMRSRPIAALNAWRAVNYPAYSACSWPFHDDVGEVGYVPDVTSPRRR